LLSRSTVNQTTAKASLTQMLNCVFQRMELNSEVVHVQPIAVVDLLGSTSTESDTTFVQNFLHEVRRHCSLSFGVMQGLFARSFTTQPCSTSSRSDLSILNPNAVLLYRQGLGS
jgi:hypothetical protein